MSGKGENSLFDKHIADLRSYLNFDGLSLYLIQSGLLTVEDVEDLSSKKGCEKWCSFVAKVKKTSSAFEKFILALEEETVTSNSNEHGHNELLVKLRGSLQEYYASENPHCRSSSEPYRTRAGSTHSLKSSSVTSTHSDFSGMNIQTRSQCCSPEQTMSVAPNLSMPLLDTCDSLMSIRDLAQKMTHLSTRTYESYQQERYEKISLQNQVEQLKGLLEQRRHECEQLKTRVNDLEGELEKSHFQLKLAQSYFLPSSSEGESDNYSVKSQGVLHPKTSSMIVNGTRES